MNLYVLAFEAEAMRLLFVVLWVFSLDMTQVIFELDCKGATDLVLEAKLDFSKVGAVILDCKNFLFDFPKFFVKFGG